jgi:hypothetical protein
MLQEILGGGGGESSGDDGQGGAGGSSSRRVSNPSDTTPTTFDLNWSYSENGPTDPQPQPSVCTFMGVPKTSAAGVGKKRPDSSVFPLQMAIQLLRQEGFTFEIPANYKPEYSFYSDRTKYPDSTPELSYLRDKYYEEMQVKKDNETVLVLTMSCEWFYVRCANDTACSIVEGKLAFHFALGRVPHEAKTIAISDDLEVALRTGNRSTNLEDANCRPGTLFELKKNGKVISKCLCSYRNCEMDNAGPTIELFETAAEWQCHGYGDQLMSVVESHFEDVFASVTEHTRVKFNVCYVTNRHACEWFLVQGFEDWDGMGEELGKYLLEHDYDEECKDYDDDDEDDDEERDER